MKVVINPSWECQLSCDYCWLPHTKINRDAEERSWGHWATAIKKHVPRGSTIDVAGGEPLLYPDLTKMLDEIGRNGINWAITTNAVDSAIVDELTDRKIPGCIVINVSDHSTSKPIHRTVTRNIAKLKTVYPVTIHKCDHPSAGKRKNTKPISYQEWEEGTALDGVKRECTAGVNHWVIDPAGDVFRCCVDMQVSNKPLFNIFTFDGLVWLGFMDMDRACDFGCSSCYTENPAEWMLEMQEV